jgi:hypothetical protein
MSRKKRAKVVTDIEPIPFESKIMDLERKRFGINKYDPYVDNDKSDDLFDEYQKKKNKNRKRKKKNKDDDYSRNDNVFSNSKNKDLKDVRDSRRSSTGSFERYKTDLSNRESTNTKVDQMTRFSSTPQLGSQKHRNILNGRIHDPNAFTKYDVDRSRGHLSNSRGDRSRGHLSNSRGDRSLGHLSNSRDDRSLGHLSNSRGDRSLGHFSNSRGDLPQRRNSHANDYLVEGHRQFRSLAFDDEYKGTNASTKNFITPKKSESLLSRAHRDRELERYVGSTISKPKTVLFDETQNDIRLFDDRKYHKNHEKNNETSSNTKDGLNTYTRTFLFKELDKIRHDSNKNNMLLSKNISDNEDFYSQKFEELRTKLKNDVVNPNEVQRLVNQVVDKKLIQMNLKDDTEKSKEGVSKMQAQINSIVSHYNAREEQTTKLQDEIELLNKGIEVLHRKTEKDQENYVHRIEILEKTLADVREDCVASTDSFIVNVESRLENMDKWIRDTESKREIKKVSHLNQSGVSDQYINNLRKDIDAALKKLNFRINDVNHKSNSGVEALKDLKDLEQKVNQIDDYVETADMNINRKVNLLQTTPVVTKAPVNGSAKAIESRLTRLETIVVRHGKLLDEITGDILKAEKNLRKPPKSPCACEKYTEDFANKLQNNFDNRIGALEASVYNNDETEFREQVFKEIDGIKLAAIDDIK